MDRPTLVMRLRAQSGQRRWAQEAMTPPSLGRALPQPPQKPPLPKSAFSPAKGVA